MYVSFLLSSFSDSSISYNLHSSSDPPIILSSIATANSCHQLPYLLSPEEMRKGGHEGTSTVANTLPTHQASDRTRLKQPKVGDPQIDPPPPSRSCAVRLVEQGQCRPVLSHISISASVNPVYFLTTRGAVLSCHTTAWHGYGWRDVISCMLL